ncbi:MAG: NAD(P)-binding domain-containing protein [Nannocystaceae bacterium]
MPRVTFLGTGLIGSGLAEAAIHRGDQVTVYNRTAAKAAPLAALGARVADSPAAAVRGAERVHVVLPDDEVVDAVLAGALAEVGDAVVIDHSTTSPAGALARADRLAGRGVAFLHAPVFMSPASCRAAQGVMLCAGPRAAYERVRGDLERMTGKVHYLGERGDRAAAFKLFGNAMLISMIGALADIYAMAASLGIDAGDALGLFDAFNPAAVLPVRGKKMAAGDFSPAFELTMARKDLRLMIEAAGGRELTVLGALAERMDALIAAGHGAEDLGVLAIDATPRTGRAE